jgi:hypothetical protein
MLDAMTPRIRAVHVILCDYLDRYNLQGDADKALAQSAAWCDRYFPEILGRFDRVECTDWLTVMKTDGFSERLGALARLYKTNPEVSEAIDVNIEIYLQAKAQRLTAEGQPVDLDALAENSRRYLIEEYAGTALYKNFLPGAPEVYWGVYLDDLDAFARHAPGIDLALPLTLPVRNSRLGGSLASIKPHLKAA